MPAASAATEGRHPEEAVQRPSRRMATNSVFRAILRGSAFGRAPQDDGSRALRLSARVAVCYRRRANQQGKRMAELPRLNGIIRALEAGQPAFTCFSPAEIDSAYA